MKQVPIRGGSLPAHLHSNARPKYPGRGGCLSMLKLRTAKVVVILFRAVTLIGCAVGGGNLGQGRKVPSAKCRGAVVECARGN